ncbi:MAG: glycerophosphodiester phosphodiesterase [Betaproteobacteria bacterium]
MMQHRSSPSRAAIARLRPAIVIASLALCAASAWAFDLQGHRGARGLAPENTLAAFTRAQAIGVTTLETDLAVTRDGVLVISHDPFLNPDLVRDAEGRWLAIKGPPIRTLNLAELKRYDIGRLNPASAYARQFPEQQPADGQRFPALTELFDYVKSTGKPLQFNLETKIRPDQPDETVDAATFARFVVDAVRGAGLANRATIQSFDWRTLVESKKLAPEIETACLTIESDGMDTVKRKSGLASPWHAGLDLSAYGGSLPRIAKAAGCATWSPFWRNVTPAAVAEAHGLGLKVLPWTVNDPADMARLIDMKVDGLISDYPDRLRKAMADKGLPLPQSHNVGAT